MPFDRELWKQWEGQSVDSLYLLERCTGGSPRGAVFETQFDDRLASIKLFPGSPDSIAALVTSWEKAADLSHPALVRIFAYGETTLGKQRYAYIVMGRADENLAEVLAERFLTADEARDMLGPVLGALQYLHANGYAHGRLKPSNIMAFGDEVKISSDSLIAGGDPADDCRSVGLLLQEVLGADLPEPFAEIAKKCLAPDAATRWNLQQVEASLRGDPKPAVKSAAKWWMLAAVVVVLGLIAFWFSPDAPSNQIAATPEPIANVAPEPTTAGVKPPAEAPPLVTKQPETNDKTKRKTNTKEKEASAKQTAEKVSSAPVNKPPEQANATQAVAGNDGITQVMPAIPPAALATITGRVRVNVRVRVDNSGSVSQATLEPPGASKYFTDRVLAAAQAWKFPAENAPQEWLLRFELLRKEMRASQTKVAP